MRKINSIFDITTLKPCVIIVDGEYNFLIRPWTGAVTRRLKNGGFVINFGCLSDYNIELPETLEEKTIAELAFNIASAK